MEAKVSHQIRESMKVIEVLRRQCGGLYVEVMKIPVRIDVPTVCAYVRHECLM